MEQTTQQPTVTWDEYYRKMSSLAAEMIGAADHFDENPDWATDEHVADAFRRYVARMREVEQPA